jgi:tRNA threonylcarbamoyladenosine biosynthesis protein TsaB
MRILALDSAIGRCSATLVASGTVLAAQLQDQRRDHAAILPVMVGDVLRAAQMAVPDLDAIAVTVGPGSFTGIRAGLALAQGLSLAGGCPVVGVTVAEALAAAMPDLAGRVLWCAIPSRRGRVFLMAGSHVLSLAVTDLPTPAEPVALAGPAGVEVAERLVQRGADVVLTDTQLPDGACVAAVAQRRLLGILPAIPVEPLYVDPPEAKPRQAPAPMPAQAIQHGDRPG